ncbi:MAG TPA: Na+-transporting malonate decarboxylase, carboxybiotin decarboxylase subunit [Spirochaetota bacterium]|nr:Na+-transporting malonate decarboxylase, carboxybiotin decarboxylase subunit [Spirochaetota bacterium]HPJ34235.1 Na+-transporting malonate decarboxylase, carboxybiotin decarboxylase subunit [Spirochaetota bacterium]
MDVLINLFPGIGSMFVQDPVIAFTRIGLIIFGFILAYLGFKRTLEPLIMVPMGIGMMCINAGVLFLDGGRIGTIFLDPLVSDPAKLVDIMQVNWLQPVYSMTFSNGLIACLVFFGIGAMSEIGYILARPWASIVVALFAELGTFVTLCLGIWFGLAPNEAASVAVIGGADGPMVLFTSLVLAPELFVPISIIAYLYLSLTYAGYPYIIKMLIPKKYRGIEVDIPTPEVSQKAKFIFTIVVCFVLCILLPVASPLIMSFFLGVAIKEAEIEPFRQLLEGPITYGSTLFLGLLLGVLCEAQTILNPKVGILVVLGIVALAVSGVGGIIGGWVVYFATKKNYNPVIGISGVSCLPTTAKIAQKTAYEENPYCIIMPLAMGAGVSGLIVSAIATGVFISTIFLIR